MCRLGIAAVVLATLSIVGSALAATQVATDHEASVEFRLEGHMLTATVMPKELEIRPGIREELWGIS